METTFVREVTLRYKGPRREPPESIREANQAASFIRKVLPDNVREHFVALYLSNAHQVVGFRVVATGTSSSCPVAALDVFQPAVILGASALIISHNHPSDMMEPSSADFVVTRQLKASAEILGIRLLDHIIVTNREHYSFADMGQM